MNEYDGVNRQSTVIGLLNPAESENQCIQGLGHEPKLQKSMKKVGLNSIIVAADQVRKSARASKAPDVCVIQIERDITGFHAENYRRLEPQVLEALQSL